MVGQAERQLEGALRDTLMQVGHFSSAIVALATGHGQHTLFNLQVEVVLLETGCGNHDAVVVFAMLFHVVGRVAATGLVTCRGFEQVVETVETNGMAEQWSKRESGSHGHKLLRFSK
ncbi:hypothetical protein D3C75_1018550 [compost metagenome]